MAIRFGDKYLKYHEITARGEALWGATQRQERIDAWSNWRS